MIRLLLAVVMMSCASPGRQAHRGTQRINDLITKLTVVSVAKISCCQTDNNHTVAMAFSWTASRNDGNADASRTKSISSGARAFVGILLVPLRGPRGVSSMGRLAPG